MRAQSCIACAVVALMIVSCGDPGGENMPVVQQQTMSGNTDPIDALRAEAEGGNPASARLLGNAYNSGEGVGKDRIEAHRWWLRAAELGDVKAEVAVSKNYLSGVVVPEDVAAAVSWLKKAVEKGDVEAKALLGEVYLAEPFQNFELAHALLKSASELGEPRALGSLGYAYSGGLGVVPDKKRASDFTHRAAALGDTFSLYILGTFYFDGLGVERDMPRGVAYLQRAAEKGHEGAQNKLARAYQSGHGVPKNREKAVHWFLAAAVQGSAYGQLWLGESYRRGLGVQQDEVLAHAWLNISAAQGVGVSGLAREFMAEINLSVADQAEAERLAAEWRLDHTIQRESPRGLQANRSDPQLAGSGTAFLVSSDGHAITNFHVIDGCSILRHRDRTVDARLVAQDPANDLALLKLPSADGPIATLVRESGELKIGEDIVVFGFPLQGVLSTSGNLTPGVVSALAGIANNSAQIQITAPIQPGSSGSPVINMKGEVVGVVVQKLSDKAVAKAMNVIPQNVNFAINGQTLASFLDSNKVNYETGSWFAREGGTANVAESARKWTFAIECWK